MSGPQSGLHSLRFPANDVDAATAKYYKMTMNHKFPKPQAVVSSTTGVTDGKSENEAAKGTHDEVRKRGRGRPSNFWSKVDKNGPVARPGLSPCWLWTGSKTGDGYGRFGWRNRDTLAHRVAFIKSHGVDSDQVEAVMHVCDVRLCVNPDHLKAGTRADNNADCKAKDRHSRGERSGTSKLTEDQVKDIRFRFRNGDSRYALADKYGVSHTQICNIIRGTRWKHSAEQAAEAKEPAVDVKASPEEPEAAFRMAIRARIAARKKGVRP